MISAFECRDMNAAIACIQFKAFGNELGPTDLHTAMKVPVSMVPP